MYLRLVVGLTNAGGTISIRSPASKTMSGMLDADQCMPDTTERRTSKAAVCAPPVLESVAVTV